MRFENVEDKNTTLIFIEGNDLEAVHSQLFFDKINTIHEQCFNLGLQETDYSYADQVIYVFSTSIIWTEQYHTIDFFRNEDTIDSIISMAVTPLIYKEKRGELWTICSTVNGRARGMSKLILMAILELYNDIEIWNLIVDYNNPYWDRAISLYTGFGFQDPVNNNSSGSDYLELTFTKGEPFDKNSVRMRCKELRVEYMLQQGLDVALINMDIEDLLKIEKLCHQKREYGGGFGVEETFSEYEGRAKEYSLKFLCDLSVGNFIMDETAYVSNIDNGLFYTFHTHPNVAVDNNKTIVNPPSVQDLAGRFFLLKTGIVKHFVFESDRNGIWSFQVHPKSMSFVCGLSKKGTDEVYEMITKYFNNVVDNFFYELDKIRRMSEFSKVFSLEFLNTKDRMINQYLSDMSNFTWKNLKISTPDDIQNVPIFLINYYDWDFIKAQGFLEDWTFYQPCDIPINLNSNSCMSFNFDYKDLEPIVDAIDHAGAQDYQLCTGKPLPEMITYENLVWPESCDRWEGRQLIPILDQDYDTIITDIYKGYV